MYSPRNPYTPKQVEIFTPQEYLQRYLNFYNWDRGNKVGHLHSCSQANRHTLLTNGFCCIDYLKKVIDGQLLEISGCETGIWPEPRGFRNWLSFAWKRLEELEDGQDFFELWSNTFDERGDEIYTWIRHRFSADVKYAEIPGFSRASFNDACSKYDFLPQKSLVVSVFS